MNSTTIAAFNFHLIFPPAFSLSAELWLATKLLILVLKSAGSQTVLLCRFLLSYFFHQHFLPMMGSGWIHHLWPGSCYGKSSAWQIVLQLLLLTFISFFHRHFLSVPSSGRIWTNDLRLKMSSMTISASFADFYFHIFSIGIFSQWWVVAGYIICDHNLAIENKCKMNSATIAAFNICIFFFTSIFSWCRAVVGYKTLILGKAISCMNTSATVADFHSCIFSTIIFLLWWVVIGYIIRDLNLVTEN